VPKNFHQASFEDKYLDFVVKFQTYAPNRRISRIKRNNPVVKKQIYAMAEFPDKGLIVVILDAKPGKGQGVRLQFVGPYSKRKNNAA
jgi:hypothetical protein